MVASTGDVALADGATTETGRPFPGAEDRGSETLTLVEEDTHSVEADLPSMAADGPWAEADGLSVEAVMPSVEAEAEAVPMVVGAGKLHH